MRLKITKRALDSMPDPLTMLEAQLATARKKLAGAEGRTRTQLERKIAGLEAKVATPARLYVYDTELPGFGVTILPSGTKAFFVQYRAAGGRRVWARRVALGRFGPLTVDQARTLARKALGAVAAGSDPRAARRASAIAPTVRELGESYLEEVRAKRKPRTATEYLRLWTKHVLPAIGSARVVAVDAAEVATLHRRLRGTPYEGNRVLSLLGAFFRYAERHGVRPRHSSPTLDLEPYPERARERFLMPAEVTALGGALERAERHGLPSAPTRRGTPRDGAPASGATAKHRPKSAGTPQPANPYAIAALRFLLLSGWREQEALTLRWADVDLSRGVAVLPDTKTGKSVRHLGAPALLLLTELPRLEGSPYVFPGREPNRPLVEINRVWYAVRFAAGLGDVRLHDLRHSFASTVASAGGSLLMIRALLGHRDSSTTQKYAHLLEDPVRATADATAAQLAAWLGAGAAAALVTESANLERPSSPSSPAGLSITSRRSRRRA